MLWFYLSTVIIWMIIMYCLLKLSSQSIVDSGWMAIAKKRNDDKHTNILLLLFPMSAVPILRLFIAIAIVYMAVTPYEKFKEKHEKS